jgi:hypothetical protein
MKLKFSKSTDTEHEVKLDSSLISAEWRSGAAYAGQKASFEVRTAFVGNRAQIKIKGRSEGGKKLGKITDKIKNNTYIGEFDIPEDVEIDDHVYFEVKLPKNGLSGESNRIPVRPAVRVTNMRWSAKEARRGDVLDLSADLSGVPSGADAIITICEYDRDGVHDRIAELPAIVKDGKIEVRWEYEYHEDTDEIPTQAEMEKYGRSYNPPEYFFTVKVGEEVFGREQESGLLLFRDFVEVRLTNRYGKPIADQEFVVRFPDGTERKGKTKADGRIALADIPPGPYELSFPQPEQTDNTAEIDKEISNMKQEGK